MATTKTPVKEWEYLVSCESAVLDWISFELQSIPHKKYFWVGDAYVPYYGLLTGLITPENPDPKVAFKIAFEATDGKIRSILRNLAYYANKISDDERRHRLFEDFGQQMKAQGFPRSNL